ncbi:MAG TPA: 1-acyl-sn-glycerol-3-phosphate acyltransferase [Gemmatimonadaceae bacterium]|nr:1-acyl-sn-glycerol-3-phosphate acyltransferase [Gemmatimonadaceae bacterium]
MYLLPAFSAISSAGARVYYRLDRAGAAIPATGPVLLVANHPNSLFDPALVAVAARRPVRFLAGSRTVAHPQIGWLIRAVGSIPVYRRIDDPSEVAKNVDTFRAATAALAEGAAIGIFPEGVSLDEPGLQPLRTGAARLALSAVPSCGVVPIIPVGLVYRERVRFRSEALVIVGKPVDWGELAPGGVENAAAVRELTRRIEAALRAVTVNLERWEDAPLVEGAVAIWDAELGASPEPAHRIERIRVATEGLARVRREQSERWSALVGRVGSHVRALDLLALEPRDLRDSPGAMVALRWTLRRLPRLAFAAVAWTLGAALFSLPYRLSGWLGAITAPKEAAKSTHTMLYGAVVFALWVILLATLVTVVFGWLPGLAALVMLPLWALAVAGAKDQWRDALHDIRRFLSLQRRRAVVRQLARDQAELAAELDRVLAELTATPSATPQVPLGR